MKHIINRRDFIRISMFTAAALSVSSFEMVAASRKPLQRTGAPKKIIIIGAGLAGLSAAYELTQAGHDVTILEARTHVGGRVYTLREPFSDGLYAEAGAFWIPATHDFTMKYVKLFDLPLIPATARDVFSNYYIRGKRINLVKGVVDWPVALTPEEKNLELAGCWQNISNLDYKSLETLLLPIGLLLR